MKLKNIEYAVLWPGLILLTLAIIGPSVTTIGIYGATVLVACIIHRKNLIISLHENGLPIGSARKENFFWIKLLATNSLGIFLVSTLYHASVGLLCAPSLVTIGIFTGSIIIFFSASRITEKYLRDRCRFIFEISGETRSAVLTLLEKFVGHGFSVDELMVIKDLLSAGDPYKKLSSLDPEVRGLILRDLSGIKTLVLSVQDILGTEDPKLREQKKLIFYQQWEMKI